jgi:hypothetical protein
MPYLDDLANIARKTDLEVVEVPGWQTRGHGPMSDVRVVVCHHTATTDRSDMPSLSVLVKGRPGLSGPLSQLGLSRSGKVYVVAAGRCYHAGAVRDPSWRNSHAIGIEAEASGVDPWPEAQLQAYAKLCRVLIDYYGLDVAQVKGHKEVCQPPGRKIDPNFDMDAFRDRVSRVDGGTSWVPSWSNWWGWPVPTPEMDDASSSGSSPSSASTLSSGRPAAVLPAYLAGQTLNVKRHVAALRDFTRAEFGSGAAAPSEGHIQTVNGLLATLRRPLQKAVRDLERAERRAGSGRDPVAVAHSLELKTKAHDWVRATEKVWDFYFELFGQRQSAFGEWLVACDRITLDCYQHVYMHLGAPRSIPAPPPFCYMRTGFSPATFRRGIPLRRLGRQLNPFPLVQLPYHRMVNPWTMGAILHEVSHNLQNELQLQREVPTSIDARLAKAGLPTSVRSVWVRWNREIFGDMVGCLLGGEAFVASLLDVIGRSPAQVLSYSARSVHPTPYLRTFLACELLSRMGFQDRAEAYRQAWRRLYPSTAGSSIPPQVLATWQRAVPEVVEAVCFTPMKGLGQKSLRQVIFFEPRHQLMIEEAAGRLARGTDPGVVPERFLIGAVRTALDRKLAPPEALMRNFYVELSRR